MGVKNEPSIEACHLQLLLGPSLLRHELGVTLREVLALIERGDHPVPVLIDDDVEAAVDLPVAGVHLGQVDRPVGEARRLLGDAAWIGLSTHGVEEVEAAGDLPVTHLGLGCCFPTATKAVGRILAADELRRAVAASRRPLFAIGGIHAEHVAILRAAGVQRVAVSAAILRADDPAAAARAIRAALLD
jgi:thiamine-phosphate pyrophosphorylase